MALLKYEYYSLIRHSIPCSLLHSLNAMCVWKRSIIVITKTFEGEEKNTISGSIFKTSVTVFHYTDLPAGRYIYLHLNGSKNRFSDLGEMSLPFSICTLWFVEQNKFMLCNGY